MKLERLLEEYEVLIEVYTSKDEEGKHSLISYWRPKVLGDAYDELGNKAQVSFGKLGDKVKYWQERGKQVSIINPNNYLV